MRKILAFGLIVSLTVIAGVAQQPSTQQPQEPELQDVIRISASLVQTDVVVTDKNDRIIPDLKIGDFKVYDNGKRQEVKFIEFVDANTGPRTDGTLTIGGQPAEPEFARNLSAKEMRRAFAFVVDDLTIPFEDVVTVRNLLTNFVDHQMLEGDLVAIVRVIGGNGILQQFTSDKQILRRAIAQITPRLHTYSAFDNLTSPDQLRTDLTQAIANEGGPVPMESVSRGNTNLDASDDGTVRGFRALSTLATASEVINSMKPLPGRKSLVLLSGGLPLYEAAPNQVLVGGAPISITEGRSYLGNVSFLMRQLTDRAGRAGVVINTMDVRGLKASRGVSRFTDPGNEATSHLGPPTQGQGRLPNMGTFDNLSLDTLSGHSGLEQLADETGGISVINTSNFEMGLDRMMARSSYYLIAYTPSEAFDGKYHKVEIKVERPGTKTYSRKGYYATADASPKTLTKEQTIIKAAMSPLARREVNLAGTLQYRFTNDNRASIDVNLAIDAKTLDFKLDAAGKQTASFDVIGFVVNNLGKSEDGFSQTVTASFSPEEYQHALANGISFTGHAELPPGSYQLRAVVREVNTGKLGTLSQYLEVPDLSKKKLTASSLFLYAVDPTPGKQSAPLPLNALRQLPRKMDLRYAAVIYNPKAGGDKSQVRSQLIISRDGKIVFTEPEQEISGAIQNGQLAKVGQLSLAKARPGRYLLSLVINDYGADKKERTIVRSIDLNLVD